MPYSVKKQGRKFCVVKKGTDEVVKCHPTKAKAEAHKAALYANVPDAQHEIIAAAPDNSSGMMVALHLDPEIAATLAIENGLPPEELHITLAYMGKIDEVEVDEVLLQAVQDNVMGVSSEHLELSGTIGGLGRFPAGDDGVPVWVPADFNGLAELRVDITRALAAAGLPAYTDHGFAPHITLGYETDDGIVLDPVSPTETKFSAVSLVVGDQRWDYPLGTVTEDVEEAASMSIDEMTLQLAEMNAAAELAPPKVRGTHFHVWFSEGEETLDGRVIDPNATNFDRNPPLPLRFQEVSGGEGGHSNSKVAGVFDRIEREGLIVHGWGRLDLSEEGGRTAGDEVERLALAGMLNTWSPDFGKTTVDIEENVRDEDTQTPQDVLAHFVKATFNGGCVVATPALGSAVFELLDADGNVISPAPTRKGADADAVGESHNPDEQKVIVDRTGDSVLASGGLVSLDQSVLNTNRPDMVGDGTAEMFIPTSAGSVVTNITVTGLADPAKIAAAVSEALIPSEIAACAGPSAPPREFFSDPELTQLERWVTITDDGRFYGHASDNNSECHIGYRGMCVTAGMVADGIDPDCNFEYAMPGHVVCDDGSKIGTGPVVIKGGHAKKGIGWRDALAHYDDPDAAVGDVVYGRDEFGIWFSGALRPDVTEYKVRTLRASGVSMDAREIGGKLRYLSTPCVNTPGFPKLGVRLVASADGDIEEILSLVAAGGMPIPAPDDDEDCGCADCKTCGDTAKLEAELARMAAMLETSGVAEMALDKLEADLAG